MNLVNVVNLVNQLDDEKNKGSKASLKVNKYKEKLKKEYFKWK